MSHDILEVEREMGEQLAKKCRCGHAEHLHDPKKGCRAVHQLGPRASLFLQHDWVLCACEQFEEPFA